MKEWLGIVFGGLIGIVLEIAYSLGTSIDRRLYPDPVTVHAVLSGVMKDPPSLSKIRLWSVWSRRAALDWAEDPTQPVPYFF